MIPQLIHTLKYRLQIQQPKSKSVLLTLLSPLTKYSFLNIPNHSLGTSLEPLCLSLRSQSLDTFVKTARKHLNLWGHVAKRNFGFVDLYKLENGQKVVEELGENREIITQTAQLFQQLGKTIQEDINEDNFYNWMEVCLKLQIIDTGVWSLLMKQCQVNFQQLPPNKQYQIITWVHVYLSQKFMRFTYSPSKFIYRQNAIIDLGNISQLIFLFLDCIIKHQQINNQTLKSFNLSINLLQKISKTAVVNFNVVLRHYRKNEQNYMGVIVKGNIQVIVTMLNFISMVGLLDHDRLDIIEQKLLQSLVQKEISISQIQAIISSWSILCHHNTQLYQQHFRNVILSQLGEDSFQGKLTTLLFNLIGCGVQDPEMFQKILRQISISFPIDNSISHTIKHYLSIKHGLTELSSFPHCRANSVAMDIVKKRGKAFSNCLQHGQISQIATNSRDVAFQKELGIEHNPPQQFWLKTLLPTFNKLSKMYPHTSNGIYYNFPFCVFQLDALMVLNGQYIAFELIGTHYAHKSISQDILSSTQGKKAIKSKIISAYNIKTCEINSAGLIERTISSFQDSTKGAKYLFQKVHDIYLEGS